MLGLVARTKDHLDKCIGVQQQTHLPGGNLKKSELDKHILSLDEQLLAARASTAWIERIFSTFDLVHTKLRNRLQTAKAGKLVFCIIY